MRLEDATSLCPGTARGAAVEGRAKGPARAKPILLLCRCGCPSASGDRCDRDPLEGEGDGGLRVIERLGISIFLLTCRAGPGAGVPTRGILAGSIGSRSSLIKKKCGHATRRSPVMSVSIASS
jgi:hypothetical protein